MSPWDTEPHSAASGILDDETYDWLGVVQAMASSGGGTVVVSEDQVTAARSLGGQAVYHHAKDLTAEGAVCAVGQGVLPWKALLAEVDAGALVVIEQTDPATVREMTAQSADAIRAYQPAEVGA